MGQLAGFADGRMRRVARLLAEAAAGKITPTIGPTFPLERAADAHAAIAGRRAIGKVLLTVSPRARESLAAQ
jgi:NADPH:quinone reductase